MARTVIALEEQRRLYVTYLFHESLLPNVCITALADLVGSQMSNHCNESGRTKYTEYLVSHEIISVSGLADKPN